MNLTKQLARITPPRITPAMVVRMLADATMVQVGLVFGIGASLVVTQAPGDAGALLAHGFATYAQTALPLTVLCIGVFLSTGFYTYGRYYFGTYKALFVTLAVAISYVSFGILAHLASHPVVPTATLAWACAFSAALLAGSRLWISLWTRVVEPDTSCHVRAAPYGRAHPEGRHTLVIGGAGYIGSALVPKLLRAGHRVKVLDMLMYGDTALAPVIGDPNLEIVRGDFRHVENVVEAVRDVNSLVHLGAIVGDPACGLDEDLTIDVNLAATRMIAHLAKGEGVSRFVFASTCSVYGACDDILDERSSANPVSLYGETKLASESVLWQLADEAFTPTIVRFATIYGLSGRTRFDLVVNLLAAKAKLEKAITVFGGKQWRPFVHVDDAAAAVALILESPRNVIGNQIFNVGSNDQNFTIEEIGEIVKEVVGRVKVNVSKGADDPRNYRVSFTKLQSQLGFSPAWTVQDGVRQVLDAIERGEILDYSDARYSNERFLRESGTSRLARDTWARELIESLNVGAKAFPGIYPS